MILETFIVCITAIIIVHMCCQTYLKSNGPLTKDLDNGWSITKRMAKSWLPTSMIWHRAGSGKIPQSQKEEPKSEGKGDTCYKPCVEKNLRGEESQKFSDDIEAEAESQLHQSGLDQVKVVETIYSRQDKMSDRKNRCHICGSTNIMNSIGSPLICEGCYPEYQEKAKQDMDKRHTENLQELDRLHVKMPTDDASNSEEADENKTNQ